MSKVVTTSYDLFNRKLFSLPKILLLPQIFARQPLLLVQAFPFIFLSDWIKASAMAYLTKVIESLQQELKDLRGIRTKVESFDIKNADLLQRSGHGAAAFTRKKWQDLTVKVQTRNVVTELLTRSKAFFSFMQHNFVFVILIGKSGLVLSKQRSHDFLLSRLCTGRYDCSRQNGAIRYFCLLPRH